MPRQIHWLDAGCDHRRITTSAMTHDAGNRAPVWLKCPTTWAVCSSQARRHNSSLDFVGSRQVEPGSPRPLRPPPARALGAHPIVSDDDRLQAQRHFRSPRAQMAWAQIDWVFEYIEANLHRSLTVVELATVAGVSPTHFRRLFRLATGESPNRYVRGRRLDRAKRLIVGTQLPFREIASSVGFSDQSHLNRVMRAEGGLTPGQLRRAAR
jgi:AraC-like DNA-binding protein